MSLLRILCAVLLGACCWTANAATADVAAKVPVSAFARLPAYDSISLSPDGRYLAAPAPRRDRSVLVVMERDGLRVSATIDAGRSRYVDNYWWASDKRLFVTLSERVGNDVQRKALPQVYAIDADGRHQRAGNGIVIDTLADDERNVLMLVCKRKVEPGCATEVRRVDSYELAQGEAVLEPPLDNADFLADHDGVVRWAWNSDDDDLQRVYYRPGEGDEWEIVNDESESGIEMTPLLFARDGRSVYVRAQATSGPDRIQRFDTQSRKLQTVLRHERVDPAQYILSADGRELVGAYFLDGKPQALFIDADAPEAKLASRLDAAFPGEFAFASAHARDGSVALVTVTSDRDPGRFYAWDRARDALVFLSRRSPWIDPSRMASVQPIELRARDGALLHGTLTLPRAANGKPAPLVVNPHGGPYGVRDAWGYDAESQMLASRGYAVLKLDFRGSGGHGRAFEQSGYGEWGARMQDDLADATRWAIAQGHADASRVCIYGASYGGYAALMGAARDGDLYRCAIGVAGVYDLALMHTWGDIQRSAYGASYLGRAIGNDARELARRSPAKLAQRISIPVLLAHGGRDERVSPEHFRSMTRALERAGKPAETFFRSYEAHGFSDEENRAAFYEKLLGFLDRHIGKQG